MVAQALDLELVHKHYLFSTLEPAQLALLTGSMTMQWLENGEMLFCAGDKAEHFFMVAEGNVELFALAQDGHKKIVDVVLPGRTFAEAVMFMERHAYPVNAAAVERALVYRFQSREYLQILTTDTSACFRLMAGLCQRLHSRLIELENHTIHSARHRLVHYLLSLLPIDSEDGASIELTLPRQVIAARISVQPETLSRLLNQLVKQGLIRVRGREVRIPSISELQASCP